MAPQFRAAINGRRHLFRFYRALFRGKKKVGADRFREWPSNGQIPELLSSSYPSANLGTSAKTGRMLVLDMIGKVRISSVGITT